MRLPSFFIWIFFALCCACRTYDLQSSEGFSYSLESNAEEDERVSALIAPYKTDLEKTMNEVLNVAKHPMFKGTPQGQLGNFVADLSLAIGNKYYRPDDNLPADFCVLNNGGLRTTLPSGPITRGKIFELMPFENELVVLTLSGADMAFLFDFIANAGGVPVSNIKMKLVEGKPSDLYIGETSFDKTRSYKVITSDYLARGGDSMSFFANALKTEKLGLKLRDAILEHVISEKQNDRPLSASLDNRITK